MIKTKSLPEHVLAVVKDKGTEQPFSGEYDRFGESGTYLCRQCGLPLYRSHTKFHSGCGWPSFDEEIAGSILREMDADGRRTEILCVRCRAHLGHVFEGEGLTAKNTRHCVNSLSLDFVSDLNVMDTEEAIFAAGCFWGVEYYFKRLPGVLKAEAGYTGGHQPYPTYEEICSGRTGHYEAVRVIYDPASLDYENLTKYFFEIHDQAQTNGQGPDLGEQYQSVIFYYDDKQRQIAQKLIAELKGLGFEVATQLKPVSTFWPAETYHQDYYAKTGKHPYCHQYTKKFAP
ncbi:bifunctional methionine sulfoxide reductase B/A protein [Aquicella lusitana]|uniref:Peptide methionine sulfoxide reductase MsrA n=1 Tax=Aquicella lusitana TaxID=254246 RepID=A0A370GJ67_9COXI|nr:bifunctional methionine sulfoxide reductase B/A protein [Aquicella lusitana]RDI43785.1 peptide methionine sulfoxide reductase msrA/msrB [Aquicella lusitana]VVC74484.1 Peptide methionine sulfoxide reductase MsrA [Aquicella lusitana]